MQRKANFQMLGWFWDLHNRSLLELDPPYQRRSVWNQEYRDFFVDTVLRGLPCPAIFLYEEISPAGALRYGVVDGRQRLSTLFDLAHGVFPVSETHGQENIKGRYFDDLDDDTKRAFWGYQFSVEYVSTSNEQMISNIFDRINRNVARLTPQELRHAKFSGDFISSAEELAARMLKYLPANFPNLAAKSVRQMKDVEFTAQLLLVIENGPRSYTPDDLDQAFSDRDASWEAGADVKEHFRDVIKIIKKIVVDDDVPTPLFRGRLRNQADFYSLFGAIWETQLKDDDVPTLRDRLTHFLDAVENEEQRSVNTSAKSYYADARSASNDAGPRRRRIDIMKDVMLGKWEMHENPAQAPAAV